jgi:hypothetical protein
MYKTAAGISRRALLKGGLGAGALLAAGPWETLASGLLPGNERATPRRSRIFPGTTLAHADMHNHSHLSDGTGDPRHFFASMRANGLDVAALTDHATFSWGNDYVNHCGPIDGEPTHGERLDCRSSAGISERGWQRTAKLADEAYVPGQFTAVRGFEWSSPILGHVNVWFSKRWIDPLRTGGWSLKTLRHGMRTRPWVREIVGTSTEGLRFADVSTRGMEPFYDWLAEDPDAGDLGGGADGLACFNHPGREPNRFSGFRPDERVRNRFVAMEILNGREDYFFKNHEDGEPSPLVQCLNQGWRVGLIGVTDEHGPSWGEPSGRGRAGVWLHDLDRAGVKAALKRRHVFATFTPGLRVDASVRTHPTGSRTRMGGVFGHRRGPVTFTLDIDRGKEWWGHDLEMQVLRPGSRLAEVAHVESFRVPTPDQPLVEFTVDLDVEDGDWTVLRIADPDQPNRHPGPDGHPCNRAAIAYASPFWMDPALLS